MRISDWSSDVCSSDLGHGRSDHATIQTIASLPVLFGLRCPLSRISPLRLNSLVRGWIDQRSISSRAASSSAVRPCAPASRIAPRSEEHTSELQSLMRISYAVFCLKKKNLLLTTIHSDSYSFLSLHSNHPYTTQAANIQSVPPN